MKTVILATLLTLTALQAEDVVYYDTKEIKPSHEQTKSSIY